MLNTNKYGILCNTCERLWGMEDVVDATYELHMWRANRVSRILKFGAILSLLITLSALAVNCKHVIS